MQVRDISDGLITRRHFYTLIICLCMPFLVKAANGDELLWAKANKFYSLKQYDSAEQYYGELLKKYPANAMVQYNMGNAAFRLNKVGAAVLHYQKAALLDPGNREIADNLLLAKGRVLNPIPEASPIFFVRWWNSFLQLFSTNTWAIISLIVFVGVLALVWYARVKKEKFAHAGRWLSLSIVCLIMCGCMTWFRNEAVANSGMAVILEPATDLLDVPKPSGKILGSLPEGTVIEIYGKNGDFVNVKLPNGREGWVLASTLDKV